MSNGYSLIERIRVQRANAIAAPWLLSPAAVMAATLFAHNMGRLLDLDEGGDPDEEPDRDLYPTGVAVIHHSANLLSDKGMSYKDKWLKEVYLQKPRGATRFDKRDYAGSSVNVADTPTAFMSLEASLLLEFPGDAPSESRISRVLEKVRFSGGLITNRPRVRSFERLDQAQKACRSGHFIVDRSDAIDRENRLESLCRIVADRRLPGDPEDTEKSRWFVPACVGYAALSPFTRRAASREGLPHAYAEALVGLVEYVNVRKAASDENVFWSGFWPTSDVFVTSTRALDTAA